MPEGQNSALKLRRFPVDFAFCREILPTFRISDAPSLRLPQHDLSRLVQIDQSTGHEQPVGILVQPAVAHLGKAEEALEHQKQWDGLLLTSTGTDKLSPRGV